MPKGRAKWSRWQFDEEIAVGRPDSKTGVTSSNLSSSLRWFAASIRPGRPKNGSLATTDAIVEAESRQRVETPVDPPVAVVARAVRGAEVDDIVLAERLHPEGVGARFVPEAVPVDLDPATTFGKDAPAWSDRADGTPPGAEHHVGRLEQWSAVLWASVRASSSSWARSSPRKVWIEPI